MVSKQAFLGPMAEDTIDYKRLELMLKESDQKWEKDISRFDQKWEKNLSRIEGKLDAGLAEIKALIKGLTIQHNESIGENLVAAGESKFSNDRMLEGAVPEEVLKLNTEFINGGMCIHDEVVPQYDMIDQIILGQQFVKEEFGDTPRIGWQIDLFGQFAVQAYLLGAKVGFVSFFFGHIDYQNRIKRKKLRVLIGYSVHCLCVMIGLQLWNQWQFWITFSLEDKGFKEGRSCYEETTLVMADPEHGDDKLSWRLEVKEER